MNCCGSGAWIKPKTLGSATGFMTFPMSRKKHKMLIKISGEAVWIVVYVKFHAINSSIPSEDLFFLSHKQEGLFPCSPSGLASFVSLDPTIYGHSNVKHFPALGAGISPTPKLTLERRDDPISPSRFSSMTDISCCRSKAMCMAVSPSSSSALTSLPSLTSSCTIPTCPWMTAKCSAVWLRLFFRLTSQRPLKRRIATEWAVAAEFGWRRVLHLWCSLRPQVSRPSSSRQQYTDLQERYVIQPSVS